MSLGWEGPVWWHWGGRIPGSRQRGEDLPVKRLRCSTCDLLPARPYLPIPPHDHVIKWQPGQRINPQITQSPQDPVALSGWVQATFNTGALLRNILYSSRDCGHCLKPYEACVLCSCTEWTLKLEKSPLHYIVFNWVVIWVSEGMGELLLFCLKLVPWNLEGI